ncbi:hypothetical protein MGA5115_01787 [Marinomonas gallaica]|uniref:Uncharacterized protein n=1 Tax=Marinomonas gallaica TaxID=1806667 RepID=A0A1C3JQZ3_9GAMM|nr:hypothetical protein [Marinomonas gallaica]SBT17671.1 hypothetical protein MGA5115_01787 [Marinomonas gallaica]SBT19997.1 hypothetical protein MGA5116_00580 [Marinomonas gallaica]
MAFQDFIPDKSEIVKLLDYLKVLFLGFRLKFLSHKDVFSDRDYADSIVFIALCSYIEKVLNESFIIRITNVSVDFTSIFIFNFAILFSFSLALKFFYSNYKLEKILSVVVHCDLSLKILSKLFLCFFVVVIYIANPTYSKSYFSHFKGAFSVPEEELIPEFFVTDYEKKFQEIGKNKIEIPPINDENLNEDPDLDSLVELTYDYLEVMTKMNNLLGFHVLNSQGWLLFFLVCISFSLFFNIFFSPVVISLILLKNNGVGSLKGAFYLISCALLMFVISYIITILKLSVGNT